MAGAWIGAVLAPTLLAVHDEVIFGEIFKILNFVPFILARAIIIPIDPQGNLRHLIVPISLGLSVIWGFFIGYGIHLLVRRIKK